MLCGSKIWASSNPARVEDGSDDTFSSQVAGMQIIRHRIPSLRGRLSGTLLTVVFFLRIYLHTRSPVFSLHSPTYFLSLPNAPASE